MAKSITHQVIIDTAKCTGCGLCVSDCVGFNLELKDGKASVLRPSCISCGHCEAICPCAAVSLSGFNDTIEEIEKPVTLDPAVLLDAIKTRRSVRQFTDATVPQEVVDMIIEAGRLAPTGSNSQGTSYIVIRDKISECEKEAVGIFKKYLEKSKKLVKAFSNYNIDDHFFFKGAPLVIVICGKDKVSASLAAQNMAFMAEANGLGVLFSGFYTMCMNMSAKLRKIMGVQKNPKAVTTLVIGYPAVKYQRTAHRNDAVVKNI